MSKKIAVIDGNSLMHRAFHAVQTPMNAKDGTPTNAVFGFLSMLCKFIEIASPDAVICAFDAGKPTHRIEALAQYKAQRPPMDEDLRVQFPVIEELLAAMAVPVVKVPGWEGDDILGTIAARDEALGYETLLVTGDKDAYQLASELTRIVTTKKGITDVTINGPEEVLERYGVTPAQFIDYLGLMGDSSDNIPGVPGIGPKTATQLLQSYGSIEGVYEHLDELKGKRRENLENNREGAFLSREIATIVRDLDFELDLESASFPAYDAADIEEAFGKYQLASPMARVLALIDAKPEAPKAKIEVAERLSGEAAEREVERAIAAGELIGVAFVDPEQVSLFDEGATAAFATAEACVLAESDEALALFARIVREGAFAALDVKADVHRVYPADTALGALVTDDEVLTMNGFDLGLAGYVLNSSVSAYTYDSLMEAMNGASLPEDDGDADRAALRATAARLLKGELEEALDCDGTLAAYRDIDLPLVAVLTVMERTGAALDVPRLQQLGCTAQAELDELTSQIYDLAGESFNLSSPKQLAHILFEVLELPPVKKNQRGYSTDAKVLGELSAKHPLPGLMLTYREFAKIKATYIDQLPNMRGIDGRVHTQFNETVTTTGRLSSSDPNLQNIPVRTEFGRKIRECFVGLNPGELFLSADYSQIELRLLAHLSGDEHLVAAFNSGADLHASTAARVFGVPLEAVTPEMRSRAKAVNFGIVYGQQAFGLSQSLEIPMAEAREMIDRYFEVYPGVRTYLDQTVADAKEAGFAETMFGRKRHIPELRSSNGQQRAFGERTAMNHPMQGSAADIIKMAMNEVQRRLAAGGFAAKLMIQVHDELDFSVPPDEVEALGALVKEIMENVVALKVPLTVDVSWGATWAEAH
ncbi:MAG: DNA polymerase I [Adlercreutzia sp.]|uniref:DNA polymerase I n=1 Tax=uncultured Adlercreutzia sp. TaxID=875803 RepID=UPI00216E7246|nr:DNA polymerase I [uncultured Adlercreutzia sp.]MCI8425603.1 DNA polymerase I [Adlercreutzia sp.]